MKTMRRNTYVNSSDIGEYRTYRDVVNRAYKEIRVYVPYISMYTIITFESICVLFIYCCRAREDRKTSTEADSAQDQSVEWWMAT